MGEGDAVQNGEKRVLTGEEKYMGNASPSAKFISRMWHRIVVDPVVWLHDSVIEPARGGPDREVQHWYHKRFRRVPTVDECYYHDVACRFEATEQFRRDRKVETEMVRILRRRIEDCILYEYPNDDMNDPKTKCYDLKRKFELSATNLYIKYGDLPWYATSEDVLMKQKHRLVYERRHGPLKSAQGLEL